MTSGNLPDETKPHKAGDVSGTEPLPEWLAPRFDEIAAWFWARVEKPEVGCWPWPETRGRDPKFYAAVSLREPFGLPRALTAHRFSWILSNRTGIPHGKIVCHTCDNPWCVRPEHIFLGTHSDNLLDAIAKGRARPGTAPRGRVKAAEERILQLHGEGRFSIREIAREVGVSRQSISRLLEKIGLDTRRVKWRNRYRSRARASLKKLMGLHRTGVRVSSGQAEAVEGLANPSSVNGSHHNGPTGNDL